MKTSLHSVDRDKCLVDSWLGAMLDRHALACGGPEHLLRLLEILVGDHFRERYLLIMYSN